MMSLANVITGDSGRVRCVNMAEMGLQLIDTVMVVVVVMTAVVMVMAVAIRMAVMVVLQMRLQIVHDNNNFSEG